MNFDDGITTLKHFLNWWSEMKFKRFSCFLLIALLLMTVMATAYNGNVTVYVTNTGEKYHVSSCGYLKSKIPMSLKDAVSAGYTACLKCRPPILDTSSEPSQTPDSTVKTPTIDVEEFMGSVGVSEEEARDSSYGVNTYIPSDQQENNSGMRYTLPLIVVSAILAFCFLIRELLRRIREKHNQK